MGRIPAYIFTMVLALCILVPLAATGGRSVPRGTGASLLALGILWALVLRSGMPTGVRIPLLIIFYFILILVAIPGAAAGWADRPRREAPLTMGDGSASGTIAIVYHPGGTGFTRRTVTRLGEELAARGYGVSILTANPQLSLDKVKYRAIILGSPVYGGETRPPLTDFVAAHRPLSMPVFGVLTGGFAASNAVDRERLTVVVAEAGGRLRGGIKLLSGSDKQANDGQIKSFAEAIDVSLKAN